MTEKKYIKMKVSEVIPGSIYIRLYGKEEPLNMEQVEDIKDSIMPLIMDEQSKKRKHSCLSFLAK
jgi:hypothetical protein